MEIMKKRFEKTLSYFDGVLVVVNHLSLLDKSYQ